MKKDIAYIHIIRVVACIMVVFLHSLPSNIYSNEAIDFLFKKGVM